MKPVVIVDVDNESDAVRTAIFIRTIKESGAIKQGYEKVLSAGYDDSTATRNTVAEVLLDKCYEEAADEMARDSDDRDRGRVCCKKAILAIIEADFGKAVAV